MPIRWLLLAAPAIAVAQFRALALASVLAFAATVLRHRLRTGALPRPSGLLPALAAAVLLWVALSALWAPTPGRTLALSASLAGFVLLAAAAMTALASDPPAVQARLPVALSIGLAIGIALALADHLSDNALRAALRAWRERPANLGFGLKSAVSVIAVLLPLAATLPGVARPWRAALVAAGLLAAALLPAESAKLAAAFGLMVLGLAHWRPRIGRALGPALAALILLAPALTAGGLALTGSLDPLPRSAAHRVLIWDFVLERIAERPLLGWGGDASRAMPGGRDPFPAATLERYGLTSPMARLWFGREEAHRLPLHPHNAALQLWLELGAVGAALAAALAWALGRAAARAGPGAVGALAAGAAVSLLSYGVWQEWWWGFALLVTAALVAWPRPAAPTSAA